MENILILILGTFTLSFGIAFFSVLQNLKKHREINTKLTLNNLLLDQYYETKLGKTPTDIHQENFIKFLSDSRDWAFDYIEEVQSGLSEFFDSVGPEIEYFNKYGIAIEGMVAPHDRALKIIAKEYEKLKKFLPEGQDDRR